MVDTLKYDTVLGFLSDLDLATATVLPENLMNRYKIAYKFIKCFMKVNNFHLNCTIIIAIKGLWLQPTLLPAKFLDNSNHNFIGKYLAQSISQQVLNCSHLDIQATPPAPITSTSESPHILRYFSILYFCMTNRGTR